MKDKLFSPLLSLALLAMLTACEQPIEINPNFNPETMEVKTQFVFNISSIGNPTTKQMADATQATTSSTFRGISDAYLMTIAEDGEDGRIFNKDRNADKMYDLAAVISPGSIDANNSHRILEMSLPLKTNKLLFYGRAPQGTVPSTITGVTAKEYFGSLSEYNVSATKDEVKFSLENRLASTDYDLYVAVEKVLASALSSVMHTNLNDKPAIASDQGPEGSGTDDGTGIGHLYKFNVVAADYPTAGLTWASYSTAQSDGKSPISPSKDMYPLEVKLKDLYDQMITVKSNAGELRAASGEAILRIVKDLWTVINEVRTAEPTCKEETVAKYFANKIHLTMKTYYTLVTKNNGTVEGDVGFVIPTDDNQVTSIANTLSWMDADYKPTNDQLTAVAAKMTASTNILKSFPQYFKLPRGATHMRVVTKGSEKYFIYPSIFNTSGMGESMVAGNSFNERSYFYPPELLYFGNSPIRVSNESRTEAQYPQGAGKSDNNTHWGDDNNQIWIDGGFQVGHVLSSTRSVAMKYDINYGVAMLQTQVAYALGSEGVLYDNNNHIHSGEGDKSITPSASSFRLTGIIIGGQSKHVGWDFLPLKVNYTPLVETDPPLTMPNYEEGFIYDSFIANANQGDQQSIPTSGSSRPVYTLVFDNYMGEMRSSGDYAGFYKDGTQLNVHVALEFYNNAMDFYGNENLIRKGGYFYLIGKLQVSNPSAAPVWRNDDYVTPPYRKYKSDGTFDVDPNNEDKGPLNTPRVFIQDYITNVTFKLGPESLQHAYLTVPDLRSSSLSLGLSVDMKWETGMVFNNVILGE